MNELLKLLGLEDEIPVEAVSAVVALVGGIIKVVSAGADGQKRLRALMDTAEQLKAQLDAAKFGGPQG